MVQPSWDGHAMIAVDTDIGYKSADNSAYVYNYVNIDLLTELDWRESCCLLKVMQVGFELIAWIEIKIYTGFGFGLLYWNG